MNVVMQRMFKQLVDQGTENKKFNIKSEANLETMMEMIVDLKDRMDNIDNQNGNSSSSTGSSNYISTPLSSIVNQKSCSIISTIEDFEQDLINASVLWETKRKTLNAVNEKIRFIH